MSTNIQFQKCAETAISQVREQWPQQETRLGELIGAERPEDVQLNLQVNCEEKAHRYDVRAILVMPSATLTAEALDENIASALDRVTDLLALCVRQHLGESEPMYDAIDPVEAASADSFPASDPPSWTQVSVLG
jgi:hypothetical protein